MHSVTHRDSAINHVDAGTTVVADGAGRPVPETTEHLIDGTPVGIRRVTPIDDVAVNTLYAGMDDRESYLRFFMPSPKDLRKVVASITSHEPGHGSVGAFIGPRLIGVANFVRVGQTRNAEIALVVAHDEQLHGVGTLLLRHLRVLAQRDGVNRFVAEILVENVRVLQLLTDIGWPMSRDYSDGATHVELDLEGTNDSSVHTFVPYAAVHETHTGVVNLVGSRAYKSKKPYRTAFLDFSTVDLREEAIARELRLNRRLASDCYLGIAHLSDPAGGPDEPILVMRRMPEESRLSTMIGNGESVGAPITALARLMAEFHRSADRGPHIDLEATVAALRKRWQANLEEIAALCGENRKPDILNKIERLALQYLSGRESLFDRRIVERHIVDGHGDLIADDIFCFPDGPRALDCLDFADSLRFVDAIDDVAFLAMDLEYSGHPELATSFLTQYSEFAGDPAPRSLIDHYIAYRAVVRAKVDYIRLEQGDNESLHTAERHLRLALDHLERGTVRLCVVGGLPGTGKSTIATALAKECGATVISSDRTRRELQSSGALVGATGRFRSGLYAPAATALVYRQMLVRAQGLLETGQSVVLDASWNDAGERASAGDIAVVANAAFVEICCATDTATSSRRITDRVGGDSDATPEIAAAMSMSPWASAYVLDTTTTVDASVRTALEVWNDSTESL